MDVTPLLKKMADVTDNRTFVRSIVDDDYIDFEINVADTGDILDFTENEGKSEMN